MLQSMTATDTYLLLRAFCDELARCGVEHACTSPGSRCTPIVLSLVREPRIRCWSHIDERCAGFFALGAAKASGRPVAVTCTSGTAAANLAPAVIEAHEARVPLIVLTADRPPELRDVGAGQTIDQLKLYGDAVKWFVEVGVHDATDERLRWIRTLACRAYWTALDGRPGPGAPELPAARAARARRAAARGPTARAGGHPYVIVEPPPTPGPARGPGPHPSGRLLIVAGAGTPDSGAGWPSSPPGRDPRARRPAVRRPARASGDRPLRPAAARPGVRRRSPPRVRLPRRRPADLQAAAHLARLARGHRADRARPDGAWQDPAGVVGMRLRSGLPRPDHLDIEPGWLDGWRAADAEAADTIAAELGDQLSEPLVAARLGEWLPADATLFVASSMPIRDVEEFAPVSDTATECSPTAARTGSTAPSPPRSASPRRPAAGRAADRRRRARCTTSAGCSRPAGSTSG